MGRMSELDLAIKELAEKQEIMVRDFLTKEIAAAITQGRVQTYARFFFAFTPFSSGPFKDGWVEIRARSKEEAIGTYIEVFLSDRSVTSRDSLVGIYSEEQFSKTGIPDRGNGGAYCHLIIEASDPRRKPETI